MKTLPILSLLLLISHLLSAQINAGIVAQYSYDDCTSNDISGNNSFGQLNGSPACGCGVMGQCLIFDGIDDDIFVSGQVNSFLENPNFSISFYIKPQGSGVENLFVKADTCLMLRAIIVQADNNANRYRIRIGESVNNTHDVTVPFATTCWQHVIIAMQNNSLRVYINGQLETTSTTASIPALGNNANLVIGGGACVNVDGSSRFEGLLDEVIFYSRGLTDEEALELYTSTAPDQILTNDAIIFQGQSVAITASSTCANVQWIPAVGVDSPNIAAPTLSPLDTTLYLATFQDAFGCITTDSILINVLDPNDFDCNRILLPNAFTPNDDGLNDVLRISNAPVIDQLIIFEIYDRWGNRVFATADLVGEWDGNYGGKPVNPGTYLWRVQYVCNGNQNVAMGEVSVLR